jgi:hypothetical protein
VPWPDSLVEKRLEGAFDHVLRHARAGIRHRDLHILTGLHVAILPAVALVQIGVAGFDGELAAFRHGVAGVHREVENGGFELGRVGLDRPRAAATDDLERNVLAERAPQKIGQAVEHAVDVEQGRVERLLAGKGQEPLGQCRRALGAVHGAVQPA